MNLNAEPDGSTLPGKPTPEPSTPPPQDPPPPTPEPDYPKPGDEPEPGDPDFPQPSDPDLPKPRMARPDQCKTPGGGGIALPKGFATTMQWGSSFSAAPS
jgi:hypothetical protein